MTINGMMGMLFDTMAEQGAQALPEDETALLERALQSGSGFEGGKVRIRVAVLKWGRDLKRLEKFVREEYNVGGHSWKDGYFVDYHPGGFVIRRGEEVHKYSWQKVAKTLVDLEASTRLFDVQTMQKMYAIYQQCCGYPDPVPRLHYPQVKAK